MNHIEQLAAAITRRHFFSRTSTGLGAAALASLLGGEGNQAQAGTTNGRAWTDCISLPKQSV